MQKARNLCDFFSLALMFLLYSWLVANTSTYPTSFYNAIKKRSILQLAPNAMTHRNASESPISYRLDTWSQYENPEEGAHREGDIHELLSRKTFTTDKNILWPNGVVNYYFHSSMVNEPTKLVIVEEAMNIIMSKSCVKFVRIQPNKDGELPKNNWINITGHQDGCFSDLGRNPLGPTNLNLNVDKCFERIGHAIHEMLHALGVYHEHMRPDRDNYITIIWKNIRKEDVYNFRLMNENDVTNYGLPYDYDSIMHYSMTAFSKDKNLPTIVPTTSNVEIGQRNHLSHYDIQKILITYNCHANNTKNVDKRKEQKNEIEDKVTEKKENPQGLVFNIHNTIINHLSDKCTDSKSIDEFNQMAFMYLNQ